jgi:hypothetical protein
LLGNGLKIGWPSYFKNFRKTHVVFFLKKNGLNIGWPARFIFFIIFIFIKKNSTLLLGNGLKIGWPSYFKNFRKTHVFFSKKNGLNIGWPARFELQKKSSYLEEWSSAASQLLSFSVVPLTYFRKYRSLLSVVDFFELLFPFVCSTYPLELEYAPRAIFPILFMLDEEISSSSWGPFLLHWTLLCVILLPMF